MLLFKDIIFNPILVNNLSDVIIEVIERDINGILNVGGCEKISKYDFGKKISRVFGLDENLIKPGTSEDIKFTAKRPKNTTININKAKDILNTKLLNINESLELMKKIIKTNWLKD